MGGDSLVVHDTSISSTSAGNVEILSSIVSLRLLRPSQLSAFRPKPVVINGTCSLHLAFKKRSHRDIFCKTVSLRLVSQHHGCNFIKSLLFGEEYEASFWVKGRENVVRNLVLVVDDVSEEHADEGNTGAFNRLRQCTICRESTRRVVEL